jgi:hypothetical protein
MRDGPEVDDEIRAAFVAHLDALIDEAFADLEPHERDRAFVRAAWPGMGGSGQRSKLARIRAAGWIARVGVVAEVVAGLGLEDWTELYRFEVEL